MLTDHPPDPDEADAPARSGHGVASIIPRLREDFARPQACDADEAHPVAPASPEHPDSAADRHGP